jgi:hypothetical protein
MVQGRLSLLGHVALMRFAPIVILVVCSSSVLLAQADDLSKAREEMSAAAARKDTIGFASFMSDDITSIDSAGRLRDKAAAIDDMPPGNSQSSAETYMYGEAAIVAIGYNQSSESPARIIQAWARRSGQWQMVAFQGVRAPGNVTAATQPSALLPDSSGSESDREAVQKTLNAIDLAARSGDAVTWAGLMTSQWVSTSATGEVQRRSERVRGIAATGSPAVPVVAETSIRIHGTLALVTRRLVVDADQFWQTVIFAKDGSQWKEAAETTTPITGAARVTSR